MWPDPSHIDESLDSRAITFENPSGERGAGGTAAGGRKGSPSRVIDVGERVTLAHIEGPGTIRHIWMTFPPAPPDVMRGLSIEVFYDEGAEPSVSVPCLDFFGLPHGRPAPYASAMTTAQEGRGFNCFAPMPFRGSVRVDVVNGSAHRQLLYFQVDYTLGDVESSYLHVSFRRENPTTLRRDFVIADGLHGPGRFLGCVVGVRTIDDAVWYGEGEVKVYRDGDTANPTICGTGLEDYVGSAWGLGPHTAPFAGTPLDVRPEGVLMPDFVGFYRWHVPDPIVFVDDVRVTIQQIGAHSFRTEEAYLAYAATNPPREPDRNAAVGGLGGSSNGATTIARRRSCTAAGRSRSSPSTSARRSPTSGAGTTSARCPSRGYFPDMCRSIKTLRDAERVTATDQEVYEAALQFVRKISGYRKPAQRNEEAFNLAVDEITRSSRKLLDELVVKR